MVQVLRCSATPCPGWQRALNHNDANDMRNAWRAARAHELKHHAGEKTTIVSFTAEA